MSVKASSHSRIKTIKVICDRCKKIVEGIRFEEFTAGFYNMTKWEEYRWSTNGMSVIRVCSLILNT